MNEQVISTETHDVDFLLPTTPDSNSDVSLIEDALQKDDTAPIMKALEESREDPPMQILSQDSADMYTDMFREATDTQATRIETQDDLDAANQLEAEKITAEDIEAGIINVVSEVASGKYVAGDVRRAAQSAAFDLRLFEEDNFKDALVISNARQNTAKAELQNESVQALDSITKNYFANTQQKMAIYEEALSYLKSLEEKGWPVINDRNYFQVLQKKYPNFMYWFADLTILGAASKKDIMNFKKEGLFSPIKNAEQHYDRWMKMLFDGSMSAVEYRNILSAYIKYLKREGFTPREAREAVEKMLYNDKVGAWFDAVGDAIGIGGAAFGGVKGAVKGALKGGIIGAATGVLKGTTLGVVDQWLPTKSLVDKSEGVVYKATRGIKSKLNRALRAGNKDTAASEALKGTEKVTETAGTVVGEVEAVAKGTAESSPETIIGNINKAEPLIRNTSTGENYVTVFENLMDNAALPNATLDDSIKNTTSVSRWRYLMNSFAEITRRLRTSPSLVGLQDELIKPLAAKIAKELHYSVSQEGLPIYDSVIKAIRPDTLRADKIGHMYARVRVPTAAGSTKESLETAIKELKKSSDYVRDAFVVTLEDGVKALDIDVDLGKGFGTIYSSQIAALKAKKGGFLSKPIMDWSKHDIASGVMTATSNPQDIRYLDALRHIQAEDIRKLGKSATAALNKLNKEETQILEAVLDRTIQTRALFTPDQVLRLTDSEKITKTYEHLILLDNIAFMITNEGIRTDMARQGVRQIVQNGYKMGYGLIHQGDGDALRGLLKDRFIAVDNWGDTWIKWDDLTAAAENTTELKAINTKLNSGDYVVVELIQGPNAAVKATDTVYLMPKAGLYDEELPYLVVNYIPGWRKYYSRDAVYVKQLLVDDKTVQFMDEATKELKTATRPVIYGVHTIAASEHADIIHKNYGAIEELRQLAVNIKKIKNAQDRGMMIEVFDLALAKHRILFAPFKDYKSFVTWCDTIGIDLKHAENTLEILGHGKQHPKYLTGALKDAGYVDLVGPEKMHIASHRASYVPLDDASQLGPRRTDKAILDYNFEDATTVDIQETIQYMVNDMVNYGVAHRFREFYADRFYDTFGYLLENRGLKGAKDAVTALLEGDFDAVIRDKGASIADVTKARAAKTAQKNFKAIIGTPSKADQALGTFVSSILRTAGAVPDALKMSDKISAGGYIAADAIMQMKPLTRAQQFTVHWWLMACNWKQLAKNFLAPVALILAADRVNGARALKYMLPIAHTLMGSDSSLSKAISKGYDLKKVGYLAENIKKLGGTHQGIMGGVLEATTSESLPSKVSTFFFRTSDTGNRIVAFTTALLEVGGDTRIITDSSEAAMVASKANSYYLNMGSQGLARFQQSNIAKTLLQFSGYMLHNMETLMFDKNLTRTQRTSMALMLLSLTGVQGVAGIQVTNMISGMFSNFKESVLEPSDDSLLEEIAKGIAQGIPNTISEYLGYDVDFGSLFSLGIGDKANDLLSFSLANWTDVVPAYSSVSSAVNGVIDFYRLAHAKLYGDEGYIGWSNIATYLASKRELPSSMVSAYNLYTLISKGVKYSSSGQLIEKDQRALTIIGELVGAQDLQTSRIYAARLAEMNDKEQVAKVKQNYLETLTKAVTAFNDGDKDLAEALESMAKMSVLDSSFLTEQQKLTILKEGQAEALERGLVPASMRALMEYSTKQMNTGKQFLDLNKGVTNEQ